MATTTTTSAKKMRVSRDDHLQEPPSEAALAALAIDFEKSVSGKLRTLEENLKDVANRLATKSLDMELTIALAENKITLCLDPRYHDKAEQLKARIKELNKLVGKHSTASTTL